MLAQNDDVMADAVSTICDISNDSLLQQQIRTREEWLALERRTQQEIAEKDKRIAELEEALRQAQSAASKRADSTSTK